MPPARLGRLIPFLLAGAVFGAFSPALAAGWVNWDDPVNFFQNPHYRGLGGEQLRWMWTNVTGHYIPLTWMTLGLDYLLWGMDPAGYHFSSVLLHAVNAVLCGLVLLRLAGRVEVPGAGEGVRRWAAAAGALLYAIHPLRAESVAWITERRDLVAGLFFFLCLLAYLRAHPPGGPVSRRWLAASTALFAASLLGKTIGMTLPLALLVLDAWPLRRFARDAQGRVPWREPVVEKIPFFLVMLAGVAMTAYGQAAVGALAPLGAMERMHNVVAQPPYKLALYLKLVLLPVDLSPFYAYRSPEQVFGLKHALSALAVVGVSAALVAARKRMPGALAAWAGFVLLLGPVIGPIQAGAHVAADRYTYLAAFPLSILLVEGLLRAGGRRWPWAACGVGLALLGALCFRQSAVWTDSETLWSRAIAVDPTSPVPFNNRGHHRTQTGRLEEANADLTEAIRLDPRYPNARISRAALRLRTGNLAGAWEDAQETIRLDPGYAKSWLIVGDLHFREGKLKEALAAYTRAVELDRSFVSAYLKRSTVRGALGDTRGAGEDAHLVILMDPFNAEAWMNRAVARGELGDLDGAIADYTKALELNPGLPEAWGGRAKTHLLRRDWSSAAVDFEQALRVAPRQWPHRRDAEAGLAEARLRLRSR